MAVKQLGIFILLALFILFASVRISESWSSMSMENKEGITKNDSKKLQTWATSKITIRKMMQDEPEEDIDNCELFFNPLDGCDEKDPKACYSKEWECKCYLDLNLPDLGYFCIETRFLPQPQV